MKRNIILLVLVFIVAAGGFCAWLYFKMRPDVAQQSPDVAVSARELIAAFDKDTAAARKLYMDKIIEVSGRVKGIDTTGAVVLGEEGSASAVVIALDNKYHAKDYEKLKVNSEAVLQGVCSGYEKSSGDPDDLIASLGGTTVQLRSAGVKNKK